MMAGMAAGVEYGDMRMGVMIWRAVVTHIMMAGNKALVGV